MCVEELDQIHGSDTLRGDVHGDVAFGEVSGPRVGSRPPRVPERSAYGVRGRVRVGVRVRVRVTVF